MGTYEFDGEKYKKASKHQKEWGYSLISQIHLTGHEKILDLGCGDGALTERLADLIPEGNVLGIDASTGMIQTAKALERANLKFVRMDINAMAFKDEFDMIYSNAALHWVKDHVSLLKNSLQALKPGGSIYWNFAGNGTCAAFNRLMREIIAEPEYEPYFINFQWPWVMLSAKEYKRMAQEAGFCQIQITEENKDRYFANENELIQWIDQPCIVPFIQDVPSEKKEAFRREAVEKMVARTRQADGTCFETFRRINICAKKQ